MKTIIKEDLEIQIIADYETEQLEGNLIDSGDTAFDNRVCEDVRQQLNVGNVWAWAQVEVKCTYKGVLTASDYLGCCSYDNEQDFKEGGYYEDMVTTCLAEINDQLVKLCA